METLDDLKIARNAAAAELVANELDRIELVKADKRKELVECRRQGALLATAIDEFNAAIASIEHEEAAARKQAEADAIRAETLALARKLLGFALRRP